MSCCGDAGLNQISALDVPVQNGQLGTPLDVSGLVGDKTIELAGTYSGSYIVYGSHDGVLWAPLLYFNSGGGAQQIKQSTPFVVKLLAVRRRATTTTTVTMSVSAKAACNCDRSGPTGANQFLSLAVVPAGAQVGPRPAVDLWAVVSATGLDPGFGVICGGGSFEGIIGVEGSLDGVHFTPLGEDTSTSAEAQRRGSAEAQRAERETAGFNVAIGRRVPGTSFVSPELSPLVVPDVVRYVRANLRLGTVYQDVSLTIGGKQNCDCPSGVAPPVAVGEAETITEFGAYYGPQTFSSAGGPTAVLGQWWFDFDALTTPTINVFLGVQASTDGHGTAVFGVFILPDGDPVVGNLFGAIQPVVTATVANLTSDHGYDGNATIARPVGLKQVLLAAQPIKAAGPDVVVSWRSALIHPAEVP